MIQSSDLRPKAILYYISGKSSKKHGKQQKRKEETSISFMCLLSSF